MARGTEDRGKGRNDGSRCLKGVAEGAAVDVDEVVGGCEGGVGGGVDVEGG